VLECVVNISEGRDHAVLDKLREAAGACLLDVHEDIDHHRSVFTLAGPAGDVERDVRRLASAAIDLVDLGQHHGVHPRIGALDVVPWASLTGWPVRDGPFEEALAARDRFAVWAGQTLKLPCFVYGPERTLPELRSRAWSDLSPSTGPDRPHHSAGAVACGARPILVAYNLWLVEPDLSLAHRVASALRGPRLRTLGLAVGEQVQVSCNLISPWQMGPETVYDAVAGQAKVARAELVGLIPFDVLHAIDARRWAQLGLDPGLTIEARLERAGLNGGRFVANDRQGRAEGF
jgi:glutamate formiminotransferase